MICFQPLDVAPPLLKKMDETPTRSSMLSSFTRKFQLGPFKLHIRRSSPSTKTHTDAASLQDRLQKLRVRGIELEYAEDPYSLEGKKNKSAMDAD